MWEKTGCISSCCSSAPSLCSRASADVSHLTSPHQAPCGAACPACTLPAGHEHGSAAEHSLHCRGLVPSGHKLSLGAIQAQMLWDGQSRWALSSARLAGGEQEVLEEQGQREELPAIIYQLAAASPVPTSALTARRWFIYALKLVHLYFFQIRLLDLAITSLHILINLNYLIPFVNIAEFLATAASCDSDFHSLITKSNSIGKMCLFHLRGPADPLAAGFPSFVQLHRQNQGGQQLGRGTKAGGAGQHAAVSIPRCSCRTIYQTHSANSCSKEKQKPPASRGLIWHIFRHTGIFSGSKPTSRSSISLLGYRISSCAGAYLTPGCPVVTAKNLAARC